jgi:hypothetical protein
MSSDIEKDFASLPDTSTLTTLAAQARFEKLPASEAAGAALELWRACNTVLENEYANTGPNAATRRWIASIGFPQVPQPSNWPANSKDFYKLVVRGKGEVECQYHFKRFLRCQAEQEKANIENAIKELSERTDDAGTNELNTLKVGLNLNWMNTPETLDAEIERRFAEFKARTFEPIMPLTRHAWTILATEYLLWREADKRATKVRSGRQGALAHKHKKKLAEGEALANLANALEKDAAKEAKEKSRQPLDTVKPDSAAER